MLSSLWSLIFWIVSEQLKEDIHIQLIILYIFRLFLIQRVKSENFRCFQNINNVQILKVVPLDCSAFSGCIYSQLESIYGKSLKWFVNHGLRICQLYLRSTSRIDHAYFSKIFQNSRIYDYIIQAFLVQLDSL